MAKGRKTGGGSRKGTPNKITASLKEMILGALDELGGIKYLKEQAEKNPGAFLTLLGKVLPTTLTGSDSEVPAFNIVVSFGEGDETTAEHPQAPEQPPASRPTSLPSPAEPSQAPRPPWLN